VEPATHVFTWGLNSHGQLGLGDTQMRRRPELIQLFSQRDIEVESCAANRASTIFTTPGQAWLAGRFPTLPPGTVVAVPEVLPGVPSRLELGSKELPRRTTEMDPTGCVLTPLALEFQKHMDPEAPPGEGVVEKVRVGNMVASDLHVIAFVPGAISKVEPDLSPLDGGILIHVFATGLAADENDVFGTLSIDDTQGREEMQDDPMERLKVRLMCQRPECDVVVKARCIGKNRLVIRSPDLSLTPIAPRATRGPVHLSVQASMDGGLTWTEGGGVTLTYMEYPRSITGVDPECAPVSGGTKLLISVPGLKYPEIPTENLTVKFSCKPKAEVVEREKQTPFEQDLAGAYVDMRTTLSEYPPVGPLNIFAYGTYDWRKEVIEVISPPFDAETFAFYDVAVDASLDGKRYFSTPLKFTLYDVRVTGLRPNCGPLDQQTKVTLVTEGLVKSSRQWCHAEFPDMFPDGTPIEVRRDLPGTYDHTKHEITVDMPELKQQVAQQVEKLRAAIPPNEPHEDIDEDDPGDEPGRRRSQMLEPEDCDPDAGLAGMRIPVELSLNGQNFTDDRTEFVYYGTLDLSPAEPAVDGSRPDVDSSAPWPINTEIFCPIAKLPEDLELDTALVRFMVLDPAVEPAEGEDPTYLLKEDVDASLYYRGADAVLVTAVPPILGTRVNAEAPPASVNAQLELSLNGQHFLAVPGRITFETRPAEPEA
jgi:hypothetical protein